VGHNRAVAKKTLIIDDLTGETGARTRTLRFDGVEYEIDLTDASFADLRTMLKPYLRAARSVSGSPASSRARGASSGRASTSSSASSGTRRRPNSTTAPDSAVIRAWARSVGMPVTERGRVPAHVREAWAAAGSPR
jgi:hypothetical protein